MRKDIYAAKLQTALARIEAAGAGMGMQLSMPATRDPEMRLLQFAEQLAGELEAYGGTAPEANDAERIEAAVGETAALALMDADYDSVAAIVAASDEDLDAVEGIGPATIARLREAFG